MNRTIPARLWRTAFPMLAVCAVLLAGCTALDPASSTRSSAASATPGHAAAPTGGPFAPSEVGVHHENGIVYRTVDGQKLTLNACTPETRGTPIPAVLVVHGGGFRHGTSDSSQTMAVCAGLVDAGMAGFSVDYRLAPAHPYPAAVDDVQAAIEWLRQPAQVKRFGIDPKKIGGLGSSAGANLAMELGTLGEGDLASGSRVAAVVSLSGPTDMTAAALHLGAPPQDRIDVALEYLGCSSIEDCPAAQGASPRYHVDSTDAPLFIAHSQDERIPVQQAEVMIAAMKSAGVPVTAKLLPGKAHGFAYLDAAMWNDIVAFLHTYL